LRPPPSTLFPYTTLFRSPNYDFVSSRLGIQPFTSDFRGFIFSDNTLGARIFGNLGSNRDQFNLVYFRPLEKDTNSGLNRVFDTRSEEHTSELQSRFDLVC